MKDHKQRRLKQQWSQTGLNFCFIFSIDTENTGFTQTKAN